MEDNVINNNAISEQQQQTANCFSYKWGMESSYESDSMRDSIREWLLERYCQNDKSILNKWFSGKGKKVLDAGCGAGLAAELLFGNYLANHNYIGVDISTSIELAEKRLSKYCLSSEFIKASLNNINLPDESIDIIFSEGVLHHTDNTEVSFKHLAKMLKPGGRFMFYVYKKKAPVREFTDDYIREKLQPYSDEESWAMLKPLTRLGETLGQLNQKIEIKEDIPLLGIKKGTHDLQRLFYWHFCKLYYKESLTIEEMNHINFDWYRPLNCHRHTPEEIKNWCAECNLEIEHIDIQESGITVVAKKEPN